MKIIRPLLLCALTLLVVPAWADTPIQKTHALAADAQLSVSNVAGSVTIHVWDKHELRLTGSLGENAKLEISGDADDLSIKVKQADEDGWFGSSSMGATSLNLMVPKGVNLHLDTVSARIRADGLDGGTHKISTVSGNVQLKLVSPKTRINTVSGDVQFDGTATELDVTTVSGDVRVDKAGTKANMQTVSGDVHMQGGPFHSLAVETVSGDIAMSGSMADDVNAELHSMSGDIRLHLDGEPQLQVSAKTFSGDIHSDFDQIGGTTYNSDSGLRITIGKGTGKLTLQSFSGDIDIRKGN